MAFSLLDHLQSTKATELQQLTANKDLQRSLIAVMLGQLVVRDRQDATTLYQAIQHQQALDIWHGVDHSTIEQLAGLYNLSAESFKNFTEQLSTYTAREIKTLDDAANFKQSGVSELIQGQKNFLPNQAPDQVWQLLGLTELQGKSMTNQQPVDLGASIASLSKMMQDASQASYIDPHHDEVVTQNNSHIIALPDQRAAPQFFLILEPLIALMILIALWCIYQCLTA